MDSFDSFYDKVCDRIDPVSWISYPAKMSAVWNAALDQVLHEIELEEEAAGANMSMAWLLIDGMRQ